jgi:hypothetical protein
MWEKLGEVEGLWCSIDLSKDHCVFRNSNYDINNIRPNPTLELISLKPTIETVWRQEGQSPIIFHREFYGDIYCSTDNENIYKLNPETGLSLFISGATWGRFLGPNVFMYSNFIPGMAFGMEAEPTLTAVDVTSKKILWERTLSDQKYYGEYALKPYDADMVLLFDNAPPNNNSADNFNGVEALSAFDGSTLWSFDFVKHYYYSCFVCTPDHLIYVLHLEGYSSHNPESEPDTKIHVRNRHTGELVSVIDDAPSDYFFGFHYSSGMLFGCTTNELYVLDPVYGKSFRRYNIAPEMQDETFRIIGVMNNNVVLYSSQWIDKKYRILIVHFDRDRNEASYTQYIDGPFASVRDVRIVHDKLIIVDNVGTNHIYEFKIN